MEHFAELHLHLDGSLRPETVWELAGKQGIRIPAGSVEETRFKMQVPENCRTLEEYLERFDLPLMVLQEWEALERLSFELVEELAGAGLGDEMAKMEKRNHSNKCFLEDEGRAML